VQGDTVGLNLGGQWTDGTDMTENGVCIDGRLTKISEDLVFDYDRAAMMKPWRIRAAATGRIDLLFEPEFERISENGTPDSYFMNTHQMFGRYLARITPDNAEPSNCTTSSVGSRTTKCAGDRRLASH
jgi:Protein of unknown function (DUF2804)